LTYLDAWVALALPGCVPGLRQLFAEDRQPPPRLWRESLTTSRLLQYEVWTRVPEAVARVTSAAGP